MKLSLVPKDEPTVDDELRSLLMARERIKPSDSFVRRRFNPDVPHSPYRFEPTVKGADDVVI